MTWTANHYVWTSHLLLNVTHYIIAGLFIWTAQTDLIQDHTAASIFAMIYAFTGTALLIFYYGDLRLCQEGKNYIIARPVPMYVLWTIINMIIGYVYATLLWLDGQTLIYVATLLNMTVTISSIPIIGAMIYYSIQSYGWDFPPKCEMSSNYVWSQD